MVTRFDVDPTSPAGYGQGERNGSNASVRTGLNGAYLLCTDINCCGRAATPHIWAGHRRGRTVTDTPHFQKFSSAIRDVRYGLTWAFLIEAIETSERALIPYRWEQIGSKQLTSSQLQRRSTARDVRRLQTYLFAASLIASGRPGESIAYRGQTGQHLDSQADSAGSIPSCVETVSKTNTPGG